VATISILTEEDPFAITTEEANRISKIKDMENFFKAAHSKILPLTSYDLWMLSYRK
jgi:hypothetical protein